MNRILYLIPVIVLILLGTLFFAGLRNGTGDEIPSTLIDNPMPTIPDTALEGFEKGDLNEILAENRIVLVNYFASWCAPCRAEHPNLIKLREQGVPILGINYKDDPKNAAKFLDELGNPYAAIRTDESGRVGIDWGVSGVPETFFVDSQGIVVKRYFGPITSDALENEIIPFISAQ